MLTEMKLYGIIMIPEWIIVKTEMYAAIMCTSAVYVVAGQLVALYTAAGVRSVGVGAVVLASSILRGALVNV